MPAMIPPAIAALLIGVGVVVDRRVGVNWVERTDGKVAFWTSTTLAPGAGMVTVQVTCTWVVLRPSHPIEWVPGLCAAGAVVSRISKVTVDSCITNSEMPVWVSIVGTRVVVSASSIDLPGIWIEDMCWDIEVGDDEASEVTEVANGVYMETVVPVPLPDT